ncbi:hypothetical protein EV639_103147 [Rathayibacter tanaceti]|nr:hypothetical protein [Rathayibacter tanaceti]QHC54282.1 hypothetical protein GSU10_00480 [Rathayibacter tanaceti]TCO37960.1 hypothetical protein EV639_103147 [Rathayibacter tanaceti]
MTEQNHSAAPSGESTTPGGIHRRTIVAGAAWSVPVVGAAVGAPLAAASTTPTNPRVEFLQSSYRADPCARLTGVRVRAFDGTATTPNANVTITLPGGFKFADGTTTKVVRTGADGTATLPAITVTSPDGTKSFSAAYGTAGATTNVVTDSSARGIWGVENGAARTFTRFPAVPVASTPQGYNYFVGPGGQLWYNNGTVADANNVSGIGQGAWQTTSPANHASVKLDNNRWWDVAGSNLQRPALGVASNYNALGNNYFTAPNGTNPDFVYSTVNGTFPFTVAGSPNKANAYDISGDGAVMTFYGNVNGTNGWWRVVNGAWGSITAIPNVPANATNLGYDFFQSGSNLYYKGTRVATQAPTSTEYPGIKAFMGTGNTPRINTRNPSGVWHSGNATNPWATPYPNVPSRSKPLGYNYFLDEDGNLWFGNSIVQTGVASATVAFSGIGDDNLVNLRLRDCP